MTDYINQLDVPRYHHYEHCGDIFKLPRDVQSNCTIYDNYYIKFYMDDSPEAKESLVDCLSLRLISKVIYSLRGKHHISHDIPINILYTILVKTYGEDINLILLEKVMGKIREIYDDIPDKSYWIMLGEVYRNIDEIQLVKDKEITLECIQDRELYRRYLDANLNLISKINYYSSNNEPVTFQIYIDHPSYSEAKSIEEFHDDYVQDVISYLRDLGLIQVSPRSNNFYYEGVIEDIDESYINFDDKAYIVLR